MSPDRWLMGGAHPARRAAYVMIFMALAIVGLAVWNWNLNSRVSTGEAIRRSDAKNAAARELQGCKYLDALVETAINIPLDNLADILRGSLTDDERAKREAAQTRYRMQKLTFQPAIDRCKLILKAANK